MNPLRAVWRVLFADDDRPPGPDDDVLLAVTSDGQAVAEMWKGMLESAGIPALVKSRMPFPVSLDLGYGSAPVEVYVAYRNLERAREVLAYPGEHVEEYDADRV